MGDFSILAAGRPSCPSSFIMMGREVPGKVTEGVMVGSLLDATVNHSIVIGGYMSGNNTALGKSSVSKVEQKSQKH